jgi:hypothetical protein
MLYRNHWNRCRTDDLRAAGRQNQNLLHNMVHRTTLSVSQLVLVKSGSFSSGLWCSVRGSEETSCLRNLRRPLNTEGWRHRVPWKHWQPITSYRNVIPQKNEIHNHTAVNVSKLTMTGEKKLLTGSHRDVTWDTDLTCSGRNWGKSRNTSIRTTSLLTDI